MPSTLFPIASDSDVRLHYNQAKKRKASRGHLSGVCGAGAFTFFFFSSRHFEQNNIPFYLHLFFHRKNVVFFQFMCL